ncbi:MAG: DNA alkylation repair protein, partial [Verrucomicrobiota bacterium]
ADAARMTKKDLQRWVEKANGGSLPGATVPWVAAGSPFGHELALEWIDSTHPLVASAGWARLSSEASIKNDADLDLLEWNRLLQRVQKTIRNEPDAVRSAMNHFIIAVGCYVESLTTLALELGEKLGPITANLGDNNCQIPFAPDYIRKVQARGGIGKKRKSAKC